MTVIKRKGGRVCDSKCHEAKGDKCTCICGGKYHGICCQDKPKKKENKK